MYKDQPKIVGVHQPHPHTSSIEMIAPQFLGLLATALLPFASADCPAGSIGVGSANGVGIIYEFLFLFYPLIYG